MEKDRPPQNPAKPDERGAGAARNVRVAHLQEHPPAGSAVGSFEDAGSIDADLTIHFENAGAVVHQPPGCDSGAIWISGRNPVSCGQGDQLRAAALENPSAATKRTLSSRSAARLAKRRSRGWCLP
jgi:hypothetical protein